MSPHLCVHLLHDLVYVVVALVDHFHEDVAFFNDFLVFDFHGDFRDLAILLNLFITIDRGCLEQLLQVPRLDSRS